MSSILSEKPNTTEQSKTRSSSPTDNHIDHIEESIPLDFNDPHRAALEENPEYAEKLTPSTALAVVVRTIAHPDLSSTSDAYCIFSS